MPTPRKPRYSVIADDVSRAIERGHYAVGTLLPSEAELRAKYDVSHHTVRDAMRVLQELRLVVPERGRGTCVVARSAKSRYVHSLDTIPDLGEVARETRIKVLRRERIRRSQADSALPDHSTGGFGSSSHLAVTLFSYLSGVKFNHVPYKGAGPALADVVAGHVDFAVATMPGAIQQVRSGTPPALVARINALLRQAVDASDTRERLRAQGVEPDLLLPDQFRDKVKSEIELWAPVIIKAGMKGSL